MSGSVRRTSSMGRNRIDHRDEATIPHHTRCRLHYRNLSDASRRPPASGDLPVGDCTMGRQVLGGAPDVTFAGLARFMAELDLERVKQDAAPPHEQEQ